MIPLHAHELADAWTSGDWLRAIFFPFTQLLGEPTVGMVLGGSVFVAFWIATDDLALPTVILLLLSGVLIGILPADLQEIAYGALVIATAAAILEAYRRYVR